MKLRFCSLSFSSHFRSRITFVLDSPLRVHAILFLLFSLGSSGANVGSVLLLANCDLRPATSGFEEQKRLMLHVSATTPALNERINVRSYELSDCLSN